MWWPISRHQKKFPLRFADFGLPNMHIEKCVTPGLGDFANPDISQHRSMREWASLKDKVEADGAPFYQIVPVSRCPNESFKTFEDSLVTSSHEPDVPAGLWNRLLGVCLRLVDGSDDTVKNKDLCVRRLEHDRDIKNEFVECAQDTSALTGTRKYVTNPIWPPVQSFQN